MVNERRHHPQVFTLLCLLLGASRMAAAMAPLALAAASDAPPPRLFVRV